MPLDLTVHVVDDDDAVRASLRLLLTSAGFTALAYASAIKFLAEPEPAGGCVVTDVRMPGISGLELIDRMRTAGLTHPVIVITGHGDVSLAVEAMKRGAVDFLEKPFDEETFLGAVQNAMARQLSAAEGQAEKRRARQVLASLSARELSVLDGLLAGDSSKTIARALGLSPRTVEEYRANVMAKMGAGSLARLVQLALLGRSKN